MCYKDCASFSSPCSLHTFFVPAVLVNHGQDDRIHEKEENDLLENVQNSIKALVEIIRAHKSQNKFSQVLVSKLFQKRQNEAEAAINEAITLLQVRVIDYLTRPCPRSEAPSLVATDKQDRKPWITFKAPFSGLDQLFANQLSFPVLNKLRWLGKADPAT